MHLPSPAIRCFSKSAAATPFPQKCLHERGAEAPSECSEPAQMAQEKQISAFPSISWL